MKWQDHNPEVEVLVRNSDRWINVVSHLAKSLKTDGRCWKWQAMRLLVMNPNQELWKAQEPLSKMKERERISVKEDKVNPYKVSNRDEKFQKRGRRLWRKKCSK